MNVNNKSTIVRHPPAAGRAVLKTFLIVTLCFAFLAGSVDGASALTQPTVKNRSFEKDTDGNGIPNNWAKLFPKASDKRVCNQSYAGSCSFKMVGDGDNKKLFQVTLNSSGPAGRHALLSAYTKGKSIVNGGGSALVRVAFNHTDGSGNADYFQLPAGNSAWAFRSIVATATENYSSITIWLEMSANSGKMWVDSVALFVYD
jgi:hypothetical protein